MEPPKLMVMDKVMDQEMDQEMDSELWVVQDKWLVQDRECTQVRFTIPDLQLHKLKKSLKNLRCPRKSFLNQ